MKQCDLMVNHARRRFLSGASMAAAGAAVAITTREAKAAPPAARLTYPSNRLANVSDLKVNEPLNVSYPDDDAPGVLLKLGKRVPTGVGPDGDIVGFSTTCPHKGFPLAYNAERPHAELPRPLFALRLRSRRSCRSGATRRKTSRNTCCASTARATSMPKASMSLLYGRLSNVL